MAQLSRTDGGTGSLTIFEQQDFAVIESLADRSRHMIGRTETEHYLEEMLRVLGDALDVIHSSACSTGNGEKVAELAETLKDVPGMVRSAGFPPLLSNTGIGKLQYKIEHSRRIMREIDGRHLAK